jgi:hypothetical protein
MQRIAELADDGVLDLRALPLRNTGVALSQTLRSCLVRSRLYAYRDV